jgi:hypothetical protein
MLLAGKILDCLGQEGVLPVMEDNAEFMPHALGESSGSTPGAIILESHTPCAYKHPPAELSSDGGLIFLDQCCQTVDLLLPILLLRCPASFQFVGMGINPLLQSFNLVHRESVMTNEKISCGKVKISLSLWQDGQLGYLLHECTICTFRDSRVVS